jgi:hypothetical protein
MITPLATKTLATTRPRRVGLELSASMSFDEWAGVGYRIARIHSGTAWALGDWLLFGEQRFGERYRSALEATGLGYQTLRNYAWVARCFAPSRRRELLSFQHHAEVASLPAVEQDLWLHRAEAQGWSRNELRRRVSARRIALRTQAPRPATVVRVEIPSTCARRWREAAAADKQELLEWLRKVADAAAEASLAGGCVARAADGE